MPYVVYALLDPRDTTCRYVGMTNDLTERFIAHITNREVNSAKNSWMLELRGKGLLPICRTLEVCDTERQAREREASWIAGFMEIGEELCNVESLGRQR